MRHHDESCLMLLISGDSCHRNENSEKLEKIDSCCIRAIGIFARFIDGQEK